MIFHVKTLKLPFDFFSYIVEIPLDVNSWIFFFVNFRALRILPELCSSVAVTTALFMSAVVAGL